jgi:hypothetical protein
MEPWIIQRRAQAGVAPEPLDLDSIKRNLDDSVVIDAELRHMLGSAAVRGDSDAESPLIDALSNVERTSADLRRLMADGPSLVLIAAKGTGKSFISNAISNTWIQFPKPTASSIAENAVIPVGDGGTTPCECIYEYSAAWSVEIQPETPLKVQQLVTDVVSNLVTQILRPHYGSEPSPDAEEPDDDGDKAPPDAGLAQALKQPRLGLDLRRTTIGIVFPEVFADEDSDEAEARTAKDLTTRVQNASFGAVLQEVLDSANLAKRQAAPMTLTPAPDEADPLHWLQETLHTLTFGAIDGMPFPSRVTVRGPAFPRLENGLKVRIVDTLGLAPTKAKEGKSELRGRTDLVNYVEDENALLVFAARRENPPDPSTPDIHAAIDLLPKSVSAGLVESVEHVPEASSRLFVAVVFAGGGHTVARKPQSKSGEAIEAHKGRLTNCASVLGEIAPLNVPRTLSRVGGVDVRSPELIEECRANLSASIHMIFERQQKRTIRAISQARAALEAARSGLNRLDKPVLRQFYRAVAAHRESIQAWMAKLQESVAMPLANAIRPFSEGGNIHHMTTWSLALGNGVNRSGTSAFRLLQTMWLQDCSQLRERIRASLRGVADRIHRDSASALEGHLEETEKEYVAGSVGRLHDQVRGQVDAEFSRIVVAWVTAFQEFSTSPDYPLWRDDKILCCLEMWYDEDFRPLKTHWADHIVAWEENYLDDLSVRAAALIQAALENETQRLPSGVWPDYDDVERPVSGHRNAV